MEETSNEPEPTEVIENDYLGEAPREYSSSQLDDVTTQEDVEEEHITFVPEVVQEAVQEMVHEVVQEMVQEAVQEVVPEVVQEMVQEAVQEAVPEVVQEAVPEVVQEMVQEAVPEVVQETTDERYVEQPSHPLDTMPEETPIIEDPVPRIVFIIPYRDREQHYKSFSAHMKCYLDKLAIPYKMFFIHQTDSRGFNRGAMKNIGFLKVKNDYPEEYKKMTFVFNDIDTMPASTTYLPFETTSGTIKHFYGFEHTLGGIVSITGEDFERLNGFPNFWAWGYEDNLLQIRAQESGIQIDRSVFYKISNPAIIRLTENYIREVNRAEYDRFVKRTLEGIRSICDLDYTVNLSTGFVDVLKFNTNAEELLSQRADYDLRNGPVPFKDILRKRPAIRMKMHF